MLLVILALALSLLLSGGQSFSTTRAPIGPRLVSRQWKISKQISVDAKTTFLKQSAEDAANVQPDDGDTFVEKKDLADTEPSLKSRVKALFKRDSSNEKFSLAKMGTNFVLAYLFISNAMGCAAVSCAWFLASKRSGLSPLAPNQWKTFTAVYAGFFVFLNVIRPTRIAFAVAFGKYWGKLISYLQQRFSIKNKAIAIGMVVFFVNIVGSCLLFASGIGLASILSGVPVWARAGVK